MRKRMRWLWLLLLLPILALGAFVLWAEITPPPMAEALAALESNAEVQVTTDRWLVFSSTNHSYAPTARAIATEGYLVIIVPMPLNLAVFASDAATDVIHAYPEVSNWAIGGHSLGGAMGARFAHSHPDDVVGLVLWAAYPDSSNDLSDRVLAVSSIHGTLDGLATTEKIATSRPLLPPATEWVAIEGGNHAQFGWYGPQRGDNQATISRAEQQRQIVAATLRLLESFR